MDSFQCRRHFIYKCFYFIDLEGVEIGKAIGKSAGKGIFILGSFKEVNQAGALDLYRFQPFLGIKL